MKMNQSIMLYMTAILAATMYYTTAVPLPITTIQPPPAIVINTLPNMMTFQQALHLYDLSASTQGMFGTTKAELASHDTNHSIDEALTTNYCAFQPYFASGGYCNPLEVPGRLVNDLRYLKELQPILSYAIQYQNENPVQDIVLNSYFSTCQSKLSLLITSLQTTLATAADSGTSGDDVSSTSQGVEGAAGPVIDQPYQPIVPNNKPSHCYDCTSLADQYYIVNELHFVLGLTTADIECVKNSHNPN